MLGEGEENLGDERKRIWGQLRVGLLASPLSGHAGSCRNRSGDELVVD